MTAPPRTDETDLCPHCSKPLTEHRNRDCWPRCGKPNPDPAHSGERCSLPERHEELLGCPPCAYDAAPAASIAALTPAQVDAIEASVAGGVAAYIRRLGEGHEWTWTPSGTVAVCPCGDVLCKGRYIRLHADRLITSYEAKVDDLARETLRASALNAVVLRLYKALSAAWNDPGPAVLEHQRRRFFTGGFPPDELAALLAALPQAEQDWINGVEHASD